LGAGTAGEAMVVADVVGALRPCPGVLAGPPREQLAHDAEAHSRDARTNHQRARRVIGILPAADIAIQAIAFRNALVAHHTVITVSGTMNR